MAFNTVTVGAPGEGKSQRNAKLIVEAAEAGEEAVVVCSPHENDLGQMVAGQLHAAGLGRRVYVDRFMQFLYVFMLNLLPRPTSADLRERRIQIERIANGFA